MGFMSAFVKATAYALTQQPTVNAVIEGTDIVYRDYVDISVAVATPKVCLHFKLITKLSASTQYVERILNKTQ